jgi:hydrogenase maturation protein HypF
MTSGNPSGAPICRTTEEAVRYLSPMCDAILTNNRDILTRADDSVMQFEEGKPYMIRRSRGYAPLPFAGQDELKGQVLAVGGELKNTFVLAKNELYYPSAYIGDLEDARSIDALSDTVPRMERLLEIKPEIVACDLHPGYHSTAFAKKYAKEHNLPLIQVQHHYAHILSCMAEHDYEGKVIGISFDGTGYGTDGTVWGGEFLLASPENFVRLGSIEPFLQAGGDAASKEGWRIAVSLLYRMHAWEQKTGIDGYSHNSGHNINNIEETLTDEQKKRVREAVQEDALALQLCDERSLSVELFMLEHNMNCAESTSAGRLFDAVSAILGIRRRSTFEGEASMALEYASDPAAAAITHPEMIFIQGEDAKENGSVEESPNKEVGEKGVGYSGHRFVFRDDDLIQKLLADRKAGISVSVLAGGFHAYLTEMILEGARYCRDLTGVTTVALSGGCFQNLLLLRKCKKLLQKEGFQVLTHSLVPPNDGGIALGQAWAAMRRCRMR